LRSLSGSFFILFMTDEEKQRKKEQRQRSPEKCLSRWHNVRHNAHSGCPGFECGPPQCGAWLLARPWIKRHEVDTPYPCSAWQCQVN